MTNEEKLALFEEFKEFLDSKNITNNTITHRRTIAVDSDNYQIGDIIDFTLGTGEEVSAMAMRQDEDGMLFVFVDCLEEERPMNSIDSNEGGYEECYLRRVLNSEILESFPEVIRKQMKPFDNGDWLRLLTKAEVFGNHCLEPMKDIRNRIAFQGKGTDAWEWYWLSDPIEETASLFADVNYGGLAHYDSASNSLGVRPAFKI